MHTDAHLFSVPNDCLWYDKLWGPSQRVVTLFNICKHFSSANVPFSICSQCPLQKGPLFEMFFPFLFLSVSYLFILLSPLANRKPPLYINQISVSCSDFPQTGFYFLGSQIFKSKRTSASTATAPDPKKRRSIKVLKKQISNLNVESTSLKKEHPHLPKVPPPPALQLNSGSCNPSSQII